MFLVNEQWASEDYHNFVLLNREPVAAERLVFAYCTSQVAKRQEMAMRRNYPPETFVYANPLRYSGLTKDCVFDCNEVVEFTQDGLAMRLAAEKLRFKDPVPPDLLADLRAGAHASRLVPKGFKLYF